LGDEAVEVVDVNEKQRDGGLLIVAEDDNEGEGDDVDSSKEGGHREGEVGRVVEDVGTGEALLDEAAKLHDTRGRGQVAVADGVVVGVQAALAEDLQRGTSK
jgi:hypothetical protein